MPLRILAILILLVNHAFAAWSYVPARPVSCGETPVQTCEPEGCCCGLAAECPCAAPDPVPPTPDRAPAPAPSGRTVQPAELFQASGPHELPSWSLTGLEIAERCAPRGAAPERAVETGESLSILCVRQT